ncbi:Tubulin-tyrosine ligase/Tubulin polyglutamylase [Carpediemonas membranifera]|uniref:Tubulin-tyrosine ligase/Tubulin polyglutamylase n=1 Tax=Carpediemonas membranifera TaxID=201153 RepID=A0A8J6B2D0_9EUKA|nr:Tubulin-tyrosine ligase/Tubulin polyglutamylase [Carpediemonas membranifera]|eukprot:KAG9396930.1 Tubulin-tyrosine ligase/Tubulin polyglutamylase [Carpediemonas membranifera]
MNGWQKTTSSSDWNIFWASIHTVSRLFHPDSGFRFKDSQIVNHFPTHSELTRKDLMVKNISRLKRELKKEDSALLHKGPDGYSALDFLPESFLLPADYSLFVEEYKRRPNAVWIMKPTGKAQGRGIFIINKLSQVKRWASSRVVGSKDAYLACRYIDNPLLVGGKKFDLRLYVAVTSYKPLRAYIYQQGFCRFCTIRYTPAASDLDNMLVHLTNVAIQKHGSEYNSQNGGKWSIENLKLFVESSYGRAKADQMFSDIQSVIIHSLKAVQPVMVSDRHCFECYGYDLLIDDTLKPWLVEVNASPSLSASTLADRLLKTQLMEDLFHLVVPPDLMDPSTRTVGVNQSPDLEKCGDFVTLIDETKLEKGEKVVRERSARGSRLIWK